MQMRALSVLATTLAALALGGAPALAGENDDDDGDDDTPSSELQNVQAPAGAPQGGVATGLGGTATDAPRAPDGLLLVGLATGVVLATGAGRRVLVRRRMS